jgi:CheY-like chemotaxis protein
MTFEVPQDDVPHWQAPAGSTVLVVEEEPTVRAMLADVLRADGYFNVEEAENGEGCLRLIQRRVPPYDAVVVDQLVQDLVADDVTAVLAEYRPALPILRLSHLLRQGEAGSSSLESILAKPFFPLRLIAAIHATIADALAETARLEITARHAAELMSRAELAAGAAEATRRRATDLVDAARRIRLERRAREPSR